jgi:hypothetical protein
VRQLRTRPLTAERIAQAFPLVQTSLPQVTLDAWCEFAEALVLRRNGAGAGIIVVLGERDYIAGLCSYRVDHDLIHGRLLSAEHFLAFDLLDPRAVAHALAEGLEALARAHQCTAIHTQLPRMGDADPDRRGGLMHVLSTRGHRVESIGMCKLLAP